MGINAISDGERRTKSFQVLAALLIGWFYWLVRYPYYGIEHDAVIYALLVARQLDPTAYASELFFVFGSQDSFSLFSPLFGWLVSAFGLDLASRSLVLVGGAAWVAACLALGMTALRRHWLAFFACFLLASSHLNYSPNYSTFYVYEHFATARSLAFPLAIFAVAAAISSRNALSLAFGVLATLFHPLLGIWALLLWLCSKLPDRLVVSGLVLVFLVVMLGPYWSSWERLQLMDPDWARLVRASSRDVFVGEWGEFRLTPVLFWLGLLWLGARHGETRMRPWYQVMTLIAAWAILISQLCSLYWPVSLVIQAQPWRALWLAEVLGVVALADLMRAAWIFRRTLFWMAIGFAIGLWSIDAWQTPWPFAALLVASWRPLKQSGVRFLDWIERHRKQACAAASIFLLALLPGYWLSLEIDGDALPVVWGEDFDALRGFLLAGGDGVFFLLLAWILGFSRWALAPGLVAIPAIALATSQWDGRTSLAKQVESKYLSTGTEPVWVESLRRAGYRKGDVVAWARHDLDVWLLLRTAYYAGVGDGNSAARQAVGMVFSRDRAIEARRRLERVSVAALLMEEPTTKAVAARLAEVREQLRVDGADSDNLHRLGQGRPTEWGVKYLCSDPLLSWIIVPHARVGEIYGVPFDPGPAFGGRHYLYDCKDVD